MKNLFNSNNSTSLFKILGVVGLLLFFVVFGLYIYQFGNLGLSNQGSVWGQFGDYLGGTLNPILSFLSLIAILFTVVIQLDQIKQMKSALKSSERPWLSIDVMIGENIHVEKECLRFDVRYVIKNVGKSPALNCVAEEYLELHMDANPYDIMVKKYNAIKANNSRGRLFGEAVFPGAQVVLNTSIPLPLDKIKEFNAVSHNGLDIPTALRFFPFIISLISYRTTFDSELHVSSFFGAIRPKHPSFPSEIFLIDTESHLLNYAKCELFRDSFCAGIND